MSRPAIHQLRRRKTWPEPTTRVAWALALAICLLLAGCGLGLRAAFAQEVDAGERYQPSSRSGREAVQELAERHFAPEWVGWAVRTARCESSFDVGARSSGWDRRYGYYEHIGPWQVSVPTWAGKAWELFGGSLYDPEVNAAMAAWIVERYGPAHWPVCGR